MVALGVAPYRMSIARAHARTHACAQAEFLDLARYNMSMGTQYANFGYLFPDVVSSPELYVEGGC